MLENIYWVPRKLTFGTLRNDFTFVHKGSTIMMYSRLFKSLKQTKHTHTHSMHLHLTNDGENVTYKI